MAYRRPHPRTPPRERIQPGREPREQRWRPRSLATAAASHVSLNVLSLARSLCANRSLHVQVLVTVPTVSIRPLLLSSFVVVLVLVLVTVTVSVCVWLPARAPVLVSYRAVPCDVCAIAYRLVLHVAVWVLAH